MAIPRRATLALVVLVGAIMQAGTGVGGVEDILDPSCTATPSPSSREGAAQRSEFAADGTRAGRRRRILHMGNHQGLRYELAGVGRRLGLAIDFEEWPERDVCCKLNVDSDRSRWLWEQHGERWLSYDVIITSDTAPIARPLLQHNVRMLAAGTRIVVWVCNRFDFRDNGPDRGRDHPLPQPLFPEPEFYALYAAAANGSLGAHVSVLPYTPFEAYYAGLKGVWIREPALRPAGLKSLDPSGHVREGKGGQADADMNVSNTLFLPPRGNDVLMSGQCSYLGLRCLRAGMQLASVDDWSPEHLEAVHLPIAYADARELRAFKAVVHIPYAWSTLAMWEFLQVCMRLLCPSPSFAPMASLPPPCLLSPSLPPSLLS